MERGIRNVLIFLIRLIVSKILGKIILKPLLFRIESSTRRITKRYKFDSALHLKVLWIA